MIPTNGPNASDPNAIRQPVPSAGSSAPTDRIVAAVRTNPAAVWSESAEPAVPGGESSETAAEN